MGLAMPRSGATVCGGGGDQRLSWSYQCSLFMFMNLNEWSIGTQKKKSAIEIDSSIWREEIGNRNRLVKKSAIEIDSSIWREEIGNRNRLVNLAGRNRQ
jgi:hypothetical protein